MILGLSLLMHIRVKHMRVIIMHKFIVFYKLQTIRITINTINERTKREKNKKQYSLSDDTTST